MGVEAELTAAKKLLAVGKEFEALRVLERAYRQEPSDPEVASYYGLVTALERGQLRRSVELCREAVQRVPESPDLHLNLARVLIKAGEKGEAIATLRRGLELDGEHEGIRATFKQLGVRRAPLFKSLPRWHPLNKYLGLIVARLRLR